MLAVFHRSSLAVAGLAAGERFDISAAQLATFTMLQLLVYAAMQIPVGLLVDRFGSRSVMLVGTLMMATAQAGFALAESYPLALVARVFVGIGDALTFICVLRLVSRWFSPRRVPFVTQLTGTLGQLGAVGAAVPMIWALSRFGLDAGVPRRSGPRARAGGGAGRGRRRRAGPALRPGTPDVAHLGAPQPGRLVVPPRHPPGLLDALHHAVQRDLAVAAVGLPVPGARRGPLDRDGRAAAHPDGRRGDGGRAGARLADRPAPLAPLHDRAGGRLVDRRGVDRGADLAGPRARCGCWWCWCWSPAWADRPR